jgi:hypothetical protein
MLTVLQLNYGPISLLTAFSKIFEKAMHKTVTVLLKPKYPNK